MSYVVIGAGIIGLYTTFELIEKGIDPKSITIVAEYVPGDMSLKYTSPYAGAYFLLLIDDSCLPMGEYTYVTLNKIHKALGENCGLARKYATEYMEQPLSDSDMKKLQFVEDLEVTKTKKFDAEFGLRFKTWVFNPPKFTEKLLYYCLQKGVSLEQRSIDHIDEVMTSKPSIVFNCTGNGAKTLGGVEDDQCYPVRGQVVVIRAPHIDECVVYWGEKEDTYIIKRPDSNTDEVILGGFYQHGRDDFVIYGKETADILSRTSKLYPQILNGGTIDDLQVLRVVAGIRPGRYGGPRVEKSLWKSNTIIHNYGASGCGYLFGLGMAHKAVSLLE